MNRTENYYTESIQYTPQTVSHTTIMNNARRSNNDIDPRDYLINNGLITGQGYTNNSMAINHNIVTQPPLAPLTHQFNTFPQPQFTQQGQIHAANVQTYRTLSSNQYPPTTTQMYPQNNQNNCCGFGSLSNCFICRCCPCFSTPTYGQTMRGGFAGQAFGSQPQINYNQNAAFARNECCFCPQCSQGIGCHACCNYQACCFPCFNCC